MASTQQIRRSCTRFEHKLANDGPRTVIESTCKMCHVSKLVSMADDSLERWESEHNCKAREKSA